MAQPKGPEAEVAAASKLSNAVLDAQILLAYAAQRGIDVQDRVIKTVVETATTVRENRIDDAKETAFWSALNALAKSVNPVSVSSLRATMDSHHMGPERILGIDIGRSSTARWAVRSYTLGILAILFFLLFIQIYWLFGNSIISNIQNSRKQIVELEGQIQTYRDNRETVQKSAALKVSDTGAVGDSKLNVLFQKLGDHQLQEKTSYHLLERWTNFFARLVPADELSANSVVEQICQGTTDDYAATCRNISRSQSVAVLLDILQRIALPLLYGLLGSCVYVLRTLSKEISTRTFSEASLIGFKIRICLGTLGGMVVAWFVTPEVADGLFKSLSPFALAFLAGYSIELVFAAMDRFLTAFTTTQEAK
jgi:hypothetical protein